MADRIGKYLTPTLLLVLTILVVASFLHPVGDLGMPANASSAVSDSYKDLPFVAGLIQGYGTMDALASLTFSIVVIQSAKVFGAKTSKEVAGVTVRAGVIAAVLLALVYVFLARIGATSQSLFTFSDGVFQLNGTAIDGGHVLSQASYFYLGAIGRAVLALVIFLACVTTATGLITACAEYFHQILPKVSHTAWATIFTLVATTFYFGGLSEIIKWSLPVLYLLYPLTVVIVFLSLAKNLFKGDRRVYQWTIGFTFVAGLYDALATLSTMTGFFQLPSAITHFFTKIVPLGAYSMSWIPLAILGFIIGMVMHVVLGKTNESSKETV